MPSVRETQDSVRATFMSVSPQLFDVLRMPLREGRDLRWSDHSASRRVAVVSQTLAQRLFKGGPAIGQRVRIGIHPRRQDIEIVGVVGDAHIYDLEGSEPGQHLCGVAAGAGAR